MTSFDYARSAPPECVRRILEFRIPARFHGLLAAFCVAALLVAGAWLVEAHRLQAALDVESIYRRRFDASERALRKTDVYENRVKRLVALDERIRDIQTSGQKDARRLAEIANALPSHAWLTAIAYDGDAIRLEGRARDLRVLSDVVRSLMHAGDLHEPTLSTAALISDPGQKGIRYALRLEGSRP
jgi:Tfp pilus assembly protein PilN